MKLHDSAAALGTERVKMGFVYEVPSRAVEGKKQGLGVGALEPTGAHTAAS